MAWLRRAAVAVARRVLPFYPDADEPAKVGSYEPQQFSGGGHVWDEVLEYRVWYRDAHGEACFRPFASYAEAFVFAGLAKADEPIVLVRQHEYIDEPEPGRFVHVRQSRITEWPVAELERTRRTADTIPAFLAGRS